MKYLLVSAVFAVSASASIPTPDVKDGDIIFHTSQSAQSVAIQRATNSPFSHMGVVFYRNGRPYVFEAVSTVRYTPLENWITRGQGGRFVVKRLKDAPAVLTEQAVSRLKAGGRQFEGKPYDLTFEWSDDRIYCSELVWKLYERTLGIRIGELQELREFNLSDPAVKAKMRERFGSKVPLKEPVISPVAMFNSERLVTAAQR